MTALNEAEKKVIALALFSFAMKHGPTFFGIISDIANKVGIVTEVEEYANSWLEFKDALQSKKQNP